MKSILCDLCLKAVDPADVTVHGEVMKGDFCPACSDDVAELYHDLNELREDLKVKWVLGMRGRISRFNTQHPKGQVPDFAWLSRTG